MFAAWNDRLSGLMARRIARVCFGTVLAAGAALSYDPEWAARIAVAVALAAGAVGYVISRATASPPCVDPGSLATVSLAVPAIGIAAFAIAVVARGGTAWPLVAVAVGAGLWLGRLGWRRIAARETVIVGEERLPAARVNGSRSRASR
jgi:hypothetical protein